MNGAGDNAGRRCLLPGAILKVTKEGGPVFTPCGVVNLDSRVYRGVYCCVFSFR